MNLRQAEFKSQKLAVEESQIEIVKLEVKLRQAIVQDYGTPK